MIGLVVLAVRLMVWATVAVFFLSVAVVRLMIALTVAIAGAARSR